MTPRRGALWIIGPGRAGLSLALMLHRGNALRSLAITGRSTCPPASLRLLRDRGLRPFYENGVRLPETAPGSVVIAVPDGAIAGVADELAAVGLPRGTPVLHLSGSRDAGVLAPLAERGCSIGALHPLCALTDPVRGAERLRGARFGVEGKGPAGLLIEQIVRVAGGRAVPISAGRRAGYHAAAALASNGVVALLSLAGRALSEAGVPEAEAGAAIASLARGSVQDVAALGASSALTGPVARGDVDTVRTHLASLSDPARAVYCLLGREALRVARHRGLDGDRADRIEQLLGDV